jgi:DNA (cytosine-5)-methyltransferase 1
MMADIAQPSSAKPWPRKKPRNCHAKIFDELPIPCGECKLKYAGVYGRMAWDDVSPAITGGCLNPSKGRFRHPAKNRAITLREAALLQTFPADYFFSAQRGKCPAAQMIGNTLPPEFIRRHAAGVRRY